MASVSEDGVRFFQDLPYTISIYGKKSRNFTDKISSDEQVRLYVMGALTSEMTTEGILNKGVRPVLWHRYNGDTDKAPKKLQYSIDNEQSMFTSKDWTQ